MQTPQQKHLETLIESTLNQGYNSLCQNVDQIIKLVSHRVDMPKQLIMYLSKKLTLKEHDKISLLFDILWFVTEKYNNKIALFNQISANKEFLFKITSVLSLKDLNENLRTKIVDIVYQWKEMFKDNKELFPNFWSFFQGFEKKGYIPSNLNFQTRYQQQNQLEATGPVNTQAKKAGSDKNIFDLLDGPGEDADFSKIQKTCLVTLNKLLQLLQLQNKIISNTHPQILDVPPILRQNMADIKILEEKVNKFISEQKNKVTIDTTMNMIKAIQLTQKRYTQLITKYLPQKFELSELLAKFQQFCKANQAALIQAESSSNKEMDLLDINDGNQKKGGLDLLDMNIPQNEPKTQQKGIKNFFGNLLDKVNTPSVQVTLSNKPIEDDFKTDLDFIKYKDPQTMGQKLDYVRNLTVDKLAQDLFKF